MNIKALFYLALALALVAFVPAVSARPVSVDDVKNDPISGTIGDKAIKPLVGINIIDGEVTIDGSQEKRAALWFRFEGLGTPKSVYGSNTGRALKVDGTRYKSCPTTLVARLDLSGAVTISVKSLPDHLSLVTLATKNGNELFTIARARNVGAFPAQDTSSNVFFDLQGRFYEQTVRSLDGTKNPPVIIAEVKEIIPNCP